MKLFRGACTVFLCSLLFGVNRASAQPAIQPGEMLTLQKAIQLTLRNHPRGLAARSEAAAVNETVGEARSQMLPQVYGSAQYLGATDNPIGDTSYINPGYIPRISGTDHDRNANASQSFAPENNYGIAIGASQYLWDFGRARGFLQQRQFEADAAVAQYELTNLQLIYEATQRYFALLAAHQKEKVFEKAVAETDEQLHAADVKGNAGLVPQIDVYTAKAELARAKVMLLDTRNEEDIDKVALDNSMALGTDAPNYQLADVLTYGPIAGKLGDFVATAFAQRPDLRVIEDQARAQGAIIKQFRSDLFPNVHAIAGYNALGTGTPVANNFDAGIMISWPIFNGFQTEHQIAEASYRRHALQHTIEDLRQQIYLQVKSAFLSWQTALEKIHRTELTVAASRARLELASNRYDAGLGNIIELTDAQRFYIEDDAAYIDALYSYSVAKAGLDEATAQRIASSAPNLAISGKY